MASARELMCKSDCLSVARSLHPPPPVPSFSLWFDSCTSLAAEPAANRLYAGAAAQVLVYNVATGQVEHTEVNCALRVASAAFCPVTILLTRLICPCPRVWLLATAGRSRCEHCRDSAVLWLPDLRLSGRTRRAFLYGRQQHPPRARCPGTAHRHDDEYCQRQRDDGQLHQPGTA